MMAISKETRRRGLPRTPGGEYWPSEGTFARQPALPHQVPIQGVSLQGIIPEGTPVRRGLPREVGGEPWPNTGFWPPHAEKPQPEPSVLPDTGVLPDQVFHPERNLSVDPLVPDAIAQRSQHPASAAQETKDGRYDGPFTRRQQIIGASLLAVCLGALVVGLLVISANWLRSLESVQSFLISYPGESHLPSHAPVGIPAWLGWQHFLNAFLIILIARTGWQIRRESRTQAYWEGRRGKITLRVWLHQSLDLLWLLNGAVFIALLAITGQWMRVVPTSWDVFPNALSALLQYVSLNWPTENGWVNYNSLQVLSYFTIIFVAAPLAALTGVRMSSLWPKNANRLNRIYPLQLARRVHFPVMIVFVLFIVVHVALVFSTGALRNLNHMYAAQGGRDPSEFSGNWTGFALFVLSLLLIGAGIFFAQPRFVVGIASRFGTVTSR